MTADFIADAPALTLTSPAAVVAAVPYLTGYQPQDSVAIVLLRGRRLALTVNAPLPQELDAEWTAWQTWAGEVVGRCRHAHADAAIALAYLPRDAEVCAIPVRCGDALRSVRAALEAHDVSVLDLLAVGSGRWRSLMCADSACCPPDGTAVQGADCDEVSAAFVYSGAAVAPSRLALEAELDPVASPLADWLQAEEAALPDPGNLTERDLTTRRDAAIKVLHEWICGRDRVDRAQAQALPWLYDVRVRDTLLWDLLAEERLRLAAADRLAELVRLTPPGFVAPVATVLAGLRWACGDGARASVAVERALQDDPGYTLALMIRQGLESGLPPSDWVGCLTAMPRSAVRHGSRRRRAG